MDWTTATVSPSFLLNSYLFFHFLLQYDTIQNHPNAEDASGAHGYHTTSNTTYYVTFKLKVVTEWRCLYPAQSTESLQKAMKKNWHSKEPNIYDFLLLCSILCDQLHFHRNGLFNLFTPQDLNCSLYRRFSHLAPSTLSEAFHLR